MKSRNLNLQIYACSTPTLDSASKEGRRLDHVAGDIEVTGPHLPTFEYLKRASSFCQKSIWTKRVLFSVIGMFEELLDFPKSDYG